MKIGISVLSRTGASLWENGIGQNVFHLAEALRGIPFVSEVVLVDCGDQSEFPGDAPPFVHTYARVPLAMLGDELDVVIEMQGGIPVEWLRRFRARGGIVVHHACGQPYAALVEPQLFSNQGYFTDPDRCDAVWLLPKDEAMAPMMRTLHRAPVSIVPYLWSPGFLDHITRMPSLSKERPFGYRRGDLARDGLRIAIFEPNISVVKAGIVPLLAAETVARRGRHPVAGVTLYNSLHFQDHHSFTHMRGQLGIARQGCLHLAGRDYFPRAMCAGAGHGMVVSHHNQNDGNYLYFDAVSAGYPLIHNSAAFADIGYYYPGFGIEAAADAIERAMREHDRDLDDYRARADAAIARHAPDHPDNRQSYSRLLLALTRGQA